MAEQQELARAHRRRLADLRASVARDTVSAWTATMDPANPGRTFPEARRLIAEIIRQSHPTAVSLASDYYKAARRSAGYTDGLVVLPADPPPAGQVDASLNATGIAALVRALRAGQQPEQARRTSAVTVSGAAGRLAASGSRQTIQNTMLNDGRAVGWARVTDGDPCAFCAMLASRGPVYKSAEMAGDPRANADRFHDHCGCTVAPVYQDSDEPWQRETDVLSDLWARITSGLSGGDAVAAWREFWQQSGDTTSEE